MVKGSPSRVVHVPPQLPCPPPLLMPHVYRGGDMEWCITSFEQLIYTKAQNMGKKAGTRAMEEN